MVYTPASDANPLGKITVHWQLDTSKLDANSTKAFAWCGSVHRRFGVRAYRRVCMQNSNPEPEVWRTESYGKTLPNGREDTFAMTEVDGAGYALSDAHGSTCPVAYEPIETAVQCMHAASAFNLTVRPTAESDGFIVSQSRSVPGCAFDAALPFSTASGDMSWKEPNAEITLQYGDNKVNFNMFTSRSMLSFESSAYFKRHSWARGSQEIRLDDGGSR